MTKVMEAKRQLHFNDDKDNKTRVLGGIFDGHCNR